MDARARTVREILFGGDQYLVPFFQRYYSWTRKHRSQLWSDLVPLLEDGAKDKHFLGPLVCTPAGHVPGLRPPASVYLVEAVDDLFGINDRDLEFPAGLQLELSGADLELDGKRLDAGNEAEAIKAGVALVPEERRSQGLLLQYSVGYNINIASLANLRSFPGLLFLSSAKGRRQAERMVKRLHTTLLFV